MKAFVTGGSGFLGSAVVRQLRERGTDVVALARSDEAAAKLTRLGATPARGEIADSALLGLAMNGVDTVYHIAGAYRIGLKEAEHAPMFLTNVDGTQAVLDAAIAAAVPRIVYVSTVNVFGNTHGKVVDESYERPDRDFLSYYDATKYLAHRIALGRAAAGAPLVIVQPGAVYGPGDHSEIGAQIELARKGKSKVRLFPELGVTMSYVDDVAEGVILAAEKGRPGEDYVLGGEVTRLGDVVSTAASMCGHTPPRLRVPNLAVRAVTPFGFVIGRVAGTGPNLHEVVRASDGVTYWASSDKAVKELGYSPRSLEQGLRVLGCTV